MLAMADAFPTASVHTSLYEPEDTYEEFAGRSVEVSWLNRFGSVRADHRKALPLLAPTFSRMRLPDADAVLCSSSGWSHAVRCEAPKVVYCYAPARWLYQTERYAGRSRVQRQLLRAVGPALRRWDRSAAKSAARYLTLSTAVQRQILETYGIYAEVVPPPLLVDPTGSRTPVAGLDAGFLLCVSRLLPYKNVDAVLRAAALRPQQRVVVVGEGPMLETYKQAAPPNVVFLGRVTEAQLRWLYASCVANVSAGFEDYGLTPIEALAFGKPSLVLRFGGFLDTVVEGETGLYFDRPEASEIARVIAQLDTVSFSTERLALHLEHFSPEAFRARLQRVVAEVV